MAYLTPAAIRSRRPDLSNTTTYPDAELTRLVTQFEETAEAYLGRAYEVRTVTGEKHTASSATQVILRHRPIVSVTALSAAGVDATVADLTVGYDTGIVAGSWSIGDLIEVSYTHGIADADSNETLLMACAEYVERVAKASRSGTSRDVIAQRFEDTYTRYSTPDWSAGRPTGYLEVDRLLNTLPNERIPAIG